MRKAVLLHGDSTTLQ